jgi:hypothetical protein
VAAFQGFEHLAHFEPLGPKVFDIRRHLSLHALHKAQPRYRLMLSGKLRKEGASCR